MAASRAAGVEQRRIAPYTLKLRQGLPPTIRLEMAYSANRTAGIAGAGPATPTFVMPGLQAALGNLVGQIADSGVKVLNFTGRNENDSHGSVLFSTPTVENCASAFLSKSR